MPSERGWEGARRGSTDSTLAHARSPMMEPRTSPNIDSVTGLVFDIQRFSLHDGPGIRTTVFFKGCPLDCWWCHNPESQSLGQELMIRAGRCIGCGACKEACAEGAISWQDDRVVTNSGVCSLCGSCVEVCCTEAREMVGRTMSVTEIMNVLERDIAFYDQSGGGVTFSGGEPLTQPQLLSALLEASGEQGLHRAVDTCGFAPWEVCDRIREHTDLFLYDLKLLDDDRHRMYCGVSNAPILDNLTRLSLLGHCIFLRIPVVPGVNDDEANIRQMGEFAARMPHLERVDLLPYHHMAAEKYERLGRDYALPAVQTPSAEQLAEIATILESYGLEVQIGG